MPIVIPTLSDKPAKYTKPLTSPLNIEEMVKKHTKINGHNRINIYINVLALISMVDCLYSYDRL